jgi:mannitol-specific phosphotransferase system IIBC component
MTKSVRTKSQQWHSALRTYLRAFLAAALSALLAVFTATGHFPNDAKEWQALIWAVLLAVLPVTINFLNRNDQRYGNTARTARTRRPRSRAPHARRASA